MDGGSPRSWGPWRAIFLAGLVLLSSCGDSDAPPEVGAELQATATRSTLFDTRRTFRLLLHNDGDAALHLGSVQLDSPRFESLPPSDRDTELVPGRDLLLPLPFGVARCDGGADAAGPALVVTVDGIEQRVELDEHPADLLARLHGVECTAAGVRERVELRFGERWEPAGPRAVRGTVELSARRPGVTAVVDEVSGNVIFGVRFPAPRSPLLEVDTQRDRDRLDVIVSADRCDPHVLIEYKRTFLYPVTITIEGGDPVVVDLEAEGAARQAFETLLESCIG